MAFFGARWAEIVFPGCAICPPAASGTKVPSRFLHGDQLTNCHHLFPKMDGRVPPVLVVFRPAYNARTTTRTEDDEDETKKCSLNSFWHFSCCVKAYLMVGWIFTDGCHEHDEGKRGWVRFNESQTGKWEVGEVLFGLFYFSSTLEMEGENFGQLEISAL